MNSEKRRTVFFRAFWRIVILLFVMIPLLWGVRTSLCASNYDKNLIPKEFTLDNYSNLLKSPSFLPGIWNSVMVSLCTILILLPIVTLASYALGRMKFKGRFLEKVLLQQTTHWQEDTTVKLTLKTKPQYTLILTDVS